MLLPSILTMLDQNETLLEMKEHAKARVPAPAPEGSGLRGIEIEIAAAAELAKPDSVLPQPEKAPTPSPFLGELLKAITKFEKPEQARVVDVFE